jgi:hypothetical protein
MPIRSASISGRVVVQVTAVRRARPLRPRAGLVARLAVAGAGVAAVVHDRRAADIGEPSARARRHAVLARRHPVAWPGEGRASARGPRSRRLHGVAHRRHRDLAVPEDARVDAVVDPRRRRLRCPLNEEHALFEDVRRDVPLGAGTSARSLVKPWPCRSTPAGVINTLGPRDVLAPIRRARLRRDRARHRPNAPTIVALPYPGRFVRGGKSMRSTRSVSRVMSWSRSAGSISARIACCSVSMRWVSRL